MANLPKKRGRPKKVPPPPQRFLISDASAERLAELSLAIADRLGVSKSDLTERLAVIAAGCEVMATLRREAPKRRKAKGNRPNIHVVAALKDCAQLHELLTGKSAKKSLAGIEWAENTNSPHAVLEQARAVLSSLGIYHNSLAWQARQALQRLE